MTRRSSPLSGWSRAAPQESGWRRPRSLTEAHAVLAALIGIAVPVAIAFATGSFGIGSGVDDLRHDLLALEREYIDIWRPALEMERQRSYAERLGELVIEDGAGGQQPWSVGFRRGWVDGRARAIDAMRDSAESQLLAEHRIEWSVLSRLDPTGATR